MAAFDSPQRTVEGQKKVDANARTKSTRGDQLKKDLRGMNYEQGKAHLSPAQGGGGTFIHELFVRINTNKDAGINRKEVIEHLKRVGIGGGFFGMVHSGVADAFLEHLDTDKNEIVTWSEFFRVAETVMPKAIFDTDGRIRPDLVDEVYLTLDANKDKGVSRKEIEASALANMPKGTSHKGTKAEVAGKLGMDALDFDKSGDISKAELLKAAEDVARIMNSSP